MAGRVNRSSSLRRTAMPRRRTRLESTTGLPSTRLRRTRGLPRGEGPQRKAPIARSGPIRWRPKRQPVKVPFIEDKCPSELRDRLFAEAGQCCRRCGRHSDSRRKLTPSHIVPDGKGGPWEWWNLHALCVTCHRWVEDNPLAAQAEVCPSGPLAGIPYRVQGYLLEGVFVGGHEAYRTLADAAYAEARL